MARRAGLVLLVAVIGWGGWTTFKVWRAWDNVPRIAFDTERARDVLAAGTSPNSTAATETLDPGETTTTSADVTITEPVPSLDRRVLNTFLVIGTDAREGGGSSLRADVILIVVFPPASDDLVMMSIPRDLYLDNPCTNSKTKINANLNGCGDAVSGPELMAIAVENYTGIPIDHFAVFDFEGFVDIVDTIGGVEICVGDRPVRDTNPGLDGFEMPAGCSIADGRLALGWVRSRKTQIMVDGSWRPMPGVNDLTRNVRQQDLLITALEALKGVRDINELASLVESVAGTFQIDDGLGLRDVIGLMWDARSIRLEDIYRPTVEVRFSATDEGESILIPVGSFESAFRTGYPNADLVFGSGR